MVQVYCKLLNMFSRSSVYSETLQFVSFFKSVKSHKIFMTTDDSMKAKVAHSLQITNVLANVTHCGHVAAGADMPLPFPFSTTTAHLDSNKQFIFFLFIFYYLYPSRLILIC